MCIMKYLSKLLCALVAVIAMCCVSCSSGEGSGKVEYLPFQEKEDGQWGLISTDGKVLFSNEFKNEPTIVRDGRFFVKNNKDLWEMYTAEEKPKKVGSAEYVDVSPFSNGRALATMPDKPICIINTDGEVVKELDRIAGKKTKTVSYFREGIAFFVTSDDKIGAINKDGDCILEPKFAFGGLTYYGGLFSGVSGDEGKEKVTFYTKKGEETFSFSADKYVSYFAADGKIAVATGTEEDKRWSILDAKGEELCKAPEKVKEISSIQGDKFIFSNDEGAGLMNFKGDILIRAKYSSLSFDGDLLIAQEENGEKTTAKYIDEKDNEIGKESFVSIVIPASVLDGKHALALTSGVNVSLIDKEGNILKGVPDMNVLSVRHLVVKLPCFADDYPYRLMPGFMVNTDYMDIDNLVAELGINPSGLDGFTFNSTAQSVVERLAADNLLSEGDDEHEAGDAYWYDVKDEVDYKKNIEGIEVQFGVHFPDKISRQTFKYLDDESGEAYDEPMPKGYAWNSIKPDGFGIVITNADKMHGKLRSLFNKLASHFSKIATLVKGNNGAKLYKMKNGKPACLVMMDKQIVVTLGAITPLNDGNIDAFKDIKEDLSTTSETEDDTEAEAAPETEATSETTADDESEERGDPSDLEEYSATEGDN